MVGPHPQNPNVTNKPYESVQIRLPGEPKYERMPLAMRAKEGEVDPAAAQAAPPGPYYHYPPPEDKTVVKEAMNITRDRL